MLGNIFEDPKDIQYYLYEPILFECYGTDK